jgi:hypothetical protein
VQSIQKHLEAPSHHSEPPRITLEHSECSQNHSCITQTHSESIRTPQNHPESTQTQLELASNHPRITWNRPEIMLEHSECTQHHSVSPTLTQESPQNHRKCAWILRITHAHSESTQEPPWETRNILRIHPKSTHSQHTSEPIQNAIHSECSGTHNPTVTQQQQ